MKLEPNKLKYVVNYGVAPYVKNILEDDVKNSDWHFVSFDESMNDVTHTSEMDICLPSGMKTPTRCKIDIGSLGS